MRRCKGCLELMRYDSELEIWEHEDSERWAGHTLEPGQQIVLMGGSLELWDINDCQLWPKSFGYDDEDTYNAEKM